jgi:hypothetical protein
VVQIQGSDSHIPPQVAGEHTVLSARITFPLQLAYVFLRGLHHPFLFGSHIPYIFNYQLSIIN